MANVLVLNSGSSSLKCVLYDADQHGIQATPQWEAQADWPDLPGPATVKMQLRGAAEEERRIEVDSLKAVIEHLVGDLIPALRPAGIDVVGHRVVHGGLEFRESTLISDRTRAAIAKLAEIAPLHNPQALAGIEAIDDLLKNVRQVAVFDTSFHATLPPESYLYPGPLDWPDKGWRRYGFHGISHSYVSRRAAALLHADLSSLRMITCHLGNGCSLCAIRHGQSVETTMGFTPLEGLVMGTRSGTIDPGLVLHLLERGGMTARELDHVLNHEAGLKGLSGKSGDMRTVTADAASGDKNADIALRVYVYRLAYFIAALVPALTGLDALVFTAGVGENSPLVRARVCERLRFLGVQLDDVANGLPASDRLISGEDSQVKVFTIRTQENLEIARECLRFIPHETVVTSGQTTP